MRLAAAVARVAGQWVHLAWRRRDLPLLIVLVVGAPLALLALLTQVVAPFVVYPFL